MKEYRITIPVVVEEVRNGVIGEIPVETLPLVLFLWAESPELAVDAVSEAIDFVRNSKDELQTVMRHSHNHDENRDY